MSQKFPDLVWPRAVEIDIEQLYKRVNQYAIADLPERLALLRELSRHLGDDPQRLAIIRTFCLRNADIAAAHTPALADSMTQLAAEIGPVRKYKPVSGKQGTSSWSLYLAAQRKIEDALDFGADIDALDDALCLIVRYLALAPQDRSHDTEVRKELFRIALTPKRPDWVSHRRSELKKNTNRPYCDTDETFIRCSRFGALDGALATLFFWQKETRDFQSATTLIDFLDSRDPEKFPPLQRMCLRQVRDIDFLFESSLRGKRYGEDWPFDWVKAQAMPDLFAYLVDKKSTLLPYALETLPSRFDRFFSYGDQNNRRAPIHIEDFNLSADPEYLALPGKLRTQILRLTDSSFRPELRQAAVQALEKITGHMQGQFDDLEKRRADLDGKQAQLIKMWGASPK